MNADATIPSPPAEHANMLRREIDEFDGVVDLRVTTLPVLPPDLESAPYYPTECLAPKSQTGSAATSTDETVDRAGKASAQGSLVLKIGALAKTTRKKSESTNNELIHAKEQAMERVRQERLSETEMGRIRRAFVTFYKPPPSNGQAAGRYELSNKREMPPGMPEALWEKALKPWSHKWWSLYDDFTNLVRAKKLKKVVNKSTDATTKECNRWAKAFHRKHGDATPESLQHKDSVTRLLKDIELSTHTANKEVVNMDES